MRCCHLQQHGWTQRLSYKWSKSDRERQIHHLVGSKEIMQVSLFTKQKQTHRHRKQTWLPRGKVRSLKMSLKIHWSEVKWSESRSITSYSLWPHDCTVHGILQARMLEWVAFLFSRGSYQHCRWILYQLSHKGSPIYTYVKWSESCSVDRYATIFIVEK